MTTRILVREVMNSPVITGGPNDTVKDIAVKMANCKVGSVVIMEDDKPVGIVTDGDIVTKAVTQDSLPSTVEVQEIMSKPLQTIESDVEVTEAARKMRSLGIKRLGVTYKGKVVGIISVWDLMAVTPELVDVLSEKARIMMGEPSRRRTYVSGYCDACGQWSDYLQDSDGKFLCEDCRGEVEAASP